MRTAYSRCGRVGLVASDMGRASILSSVFSWRNVNWVGRKVKAWGFSTSIARVLGVSDRDATTRVRKPRGGPATLGPRLIGARNAMAVFRDLEREGDLTSRAGRSFEGLRPCRSVRQHLQIDPMRAVELGPWKTARVAGRRTPPGRRLSAMGFSPSPPHGTPCGGIA